MKSERTDIPKRATKFSAGYDFYSPDNYHLEPGVWTEIDTGVSFDGSEVVASSGHSVTRWVMLVTPRSGLGSKLGLRLANTIGVIDQDYRGTIKAKITVDVAYDLSKGERFMQGIIVPNGVFGDEDVPTEVRKGGHGSTDNIENRTHTVIREVILCKDCKNYREAHYEKAGEPPYIKGKCSIQTKYRVNPNSYCWMAEFR